MTEPLLMLPVCRTSRRPYSVGSCQRDEVPRQSGDAISAGRDGAQGLCDVSINATVVNVRSNAGSN